MDRSQSTSAAPLVPASPPTASAQGGPGSEPRPGRCSLVGAGPGDPDLLTLKALRAIQSATLLLVDDLVDDATVALATPGTRIVHVGKRGGCQSTPQAFITRLMVSAALAGDTVVRLKGGDPFVFGRGGEELDELRRAGVEVEVINGITTGLYASTALGTALTHREQAHGVVFVTGHAHSGHGGVDWSALAATAHQTRLTLVIYMGMQSVGAIQRGLLKGLPATTPAAVVQDASLPTERQWLTVLASLEQAILDQRFRSPGIIVVGDVLQGLFAAKNADPLTRRA